MSKDSNTAGMNMEAGEPGMVTAVIMADATGKRRIDPRGRVVGSVQVNFFLSDALPIYGYAVTRPLELHVHLNFIAWLVALP